MKKLLELGYDIEYKNNLGETALLKSLKRTYYKAA